MTHPAAIGTGHVVRDIGLVRTLPAAVSRGAAIGTAGSVTFPQRAVQQSQFSQLIPAQVVLIFRNLNPLSDDLPNLIRGNKSVEVSHNGHPFEQSDIYKTTNTYTSDGTSH